MMKKNYNKKNTATTAKFGVKMAVKMTLAGALLLSVAVPAQAESGWFIKPEAEFIIIPSDFTRGRGEATLGGGGSLSFGYQFDAWQWETTAGWHYAGGSEVAQTIAGTTQTAEISESYIPIYTGINYTFPFLQSIDTTVGVGGGVMLYSVNKTFSNSDFNDDALVVAGLLVPKVQLDYAITDNLTLVLAGKFYMVFNGYNDLYSDTALAAVAADPDATLGEDKFFWYSGVTFGVNYRF